MGSGHQHGHGTAGGQHRWRLVATLGLTSLVLVVEVVGGLLSGSLALLADAGHMLTDVVGIGLALVAVTLAQRPPSARRTFGWQRAEVLAAAGNAGLLLAVAVLVVVEAARRITAPQEVAAGLMLAVAAVGLAVNLVGLLLLRGGARDSLNIRGAYLEVLGDLLGSVAVIVAAVLIAVTGVDALDAVASIAVVLLILPRAWLLLRESLAVLLEATPRGVDLERVRHHMLHVRGVVDVHDLHAWTITSGMPVLSAHVVVDDERLTAGGGPVLDELGSCLVGHFDVKHCTFQLEPAGHREHEGAHHP